MLVALAGLTAATGARTPVIWFKICPVLLTCPAALLVADAARPGEIVLMHVGATPDDHSTLDAAALPRVISGPRAGGYTFVTLDAQGRLTAGNRPCARRASEGLSALAGVLRWWLN